MKAKHIILLGILFLSNLSIAQQVKKISLLIQQSNVAIQKKEFDKALKYLSEASDLQTSDTTIALKVAEIASNRDTLKSIVYYQRALSSGAKNIKTFKKLAQIYEAKKLYTEAISILDKGLLLYPNNPVLIADKTAILLQTKPIKGLIKEYEYALEAEKPNKTEILQILSILYRNYNQTVQGGDKYFNTLQKQNLQSFDTNYQLAAYYYNQAVEIKKNSDRMDYNTYQREGIAIEKKAFEKFKESIKYFEKAYDIQKDEGIRNSLIHLYTLLNIAKNERKL